MTWYPSAKVKPGNASGSFLSNYAKKGVLHTTEGSSAAGAFGAYQTNNSWPHFTVDVNGTVYQHVPIDQASRAMKNLSGGVETNRGGAIQIEIVAKAATAGDWPKVQIDALKALMRWIESNAGVKPVGPGRNFASAYGQNSLRLSGSEWTGFNGWCGHCHVPENDHWDPGAIKIDALLPATEPGFQVPASYSTEEVFVPAPFFRPQGGYVVLGRDGGVFTYEGAPYRGSIPGLGVSASAIGLAWTPSGDGYWIAGADGAVFAFGDAEYKGGFNALDAATKGNRKPIGIIPKGNGYCIITLDASGDNTPFDPYCFGV